MMNFGYRNYYGDGGLLKLFIPFMLLELVLKGFALWKSAKKDQNVWFVALLVVNSMGILPLIYLVLNRDPKAAPATTKKNKKK
jgi:hypothetical protein